MSELPGQITRDVPTRGDVPNPAEVDELVLGEHMAHGPYTWRVVSDCGVVKLYSSRDGCMIALSPRAARDLADRFRLALHEAADLTEIRCFGAVIGPRTTAEEATEINRALAAGLAEAGLPDA